MILLYHKVGALQHDYNNIGVFPEYFRYQLAYLKQRYDIVPLSEHRDNTIAITFDDGFRDFYTEVFPYLKQQGIPATIFISTGKIGKKEELWTTELLRLIFTGNCHKSRFCLELPTLHYEFPVRTLEEKHLLYLALRRLCMKSEEPVCRQILKELLDWSGLEAAGREEYLMLSEEEIRELSESGLITIGAHTVNHVSLGAFSRAYQEKEIRDSKQALERITGKPVSLFSYPFGGSFDYVADTIELLKQEKIEKAYSALVNLGKDAAYEIPRITVPNLGKGEFEEWFEETLSRAAGKTPKNKGKQADLGVTYIGKLQRDIQLINGTGKIAIFGAGGRGRKLLQRLKAYGRENEVSCFLDNNREIQGKYIDGKKVIGVEQIKQENPEIILVDSVFEKEIIEQLSLAGIGGIHWLLG